jgi:hypothetical protein
MTHLPSDLVSGRVILIMKKTATISILLLVAICSTPQALTYTNPLPFEYDALGKIHRELRDPCIVRQGNTYYLLFTVWPFSNRREKRLSLPNRGGSPGGKRYSSMNLKEWKFENWLVSYDRAVWKVDHDILRKPARGE